MIDSNAQQRPETQQIERGICVYCGSRSGAHPDYVKEAQILGAGLARQNATLIYGGGEIGIMGALADAALAAAGEVVGIIPQSMVEREWAHRKLTQLIVVDGMHQRRAAMIASAHAFVALPGGFGTLEELSEALSWAQLTFHSRPVYLVNTRGYFDALLAFFDRCAEEAFLSRQHRDLVKVKNNAADLLDELSAQEVKSPHA